MSNIHIKKVNESFIRITAEDEDVYDDLYGQFTFYVPGHKFMPLFRNGIWDGQIHLFNHRNHQLPSGLMQQVVAYADANEYGVIYDSALKVEQVPPVDLSWLTLPYTPYDYQETAVNVILNDKKRLIQSPTGSGKSLIIYCAIRELLEDKKRVLLVVPTVSLVEQMYKDFKDYGWHGIDDHVHKIYAGKEKNAEESVVISTWQSIYKLGPKWFQDFDAVFVDECHLASAKSLTGIMEKSVNAEYRIGLTGTVQDAKAHKLALIGLFGEIHQTTKSKTLMDDGILSDLLIEAVCLGHSEPDRKVVSKFKYLDEVNTIVQNGKRNRFIARLAMDQKYNCLLLFKLIDHGKVLKQLCDDIGGRHVFYIDGSTKVEEREEIRAFTEANEGVVVVASFGTTSTGINIKNLNSAIFGHPYKSKIKNLQSTGRLLRIAPNGDKAILYDIADDYSWKKKKNTTYRHFLTRLELYEEEGFTYKIRRLSV